MRRHAVPFGLDVFEKIERKCFLDPQLSLIFDLARLRDDAGGAADCAGQAMGPSKRAVNVAVVIAGPYRIG